jgi:hypothetical protein
MAKVEYYCCLIVNCAHDVCLSFQVFNDGLSGACENFAVTPRAISNSNLKAT